MPTTTLAPVGGGSGGGGRFCLSVALYPLQKGLQLRHAGVRAYVPVLHFSDKFGSLKHHLRCEHQLRKFINILWLATLKEAFKPVATDMISPVTFPCSSKIVCASSAPQRSRQCPGVATFQRSSLLCNMLFPCSCEQAVWETTYQHPCLQ